MNTAYIALGSNLSQPKVQIAAALDHIRQLGTVTATSPLYASKALGPGDQPDYINGVCSLETNLKALELLCALQNIELGQGRTRTIKNAARTLDLDILLFNRLEQDQPQLILPHPRMHLRNFVIVPLYDIAPQLDIPSLGPIFDILQKLNFNDLKKLDFSV